MKDRKTTVCSCRKIRKYLVNECDVGEKSATVSSKPHCAAASNRPSTRISTTTEPNSVGQVRDVREMPSVRCAEQLAVKRHRWHLQSELRWGRGDNPPPLFPRPPLPENLIVWQGQDKADVEAGPLSNDQSAAWVPLMTTSPPDVTAAPQKTFPQKPNRNPAGFAHAENSISFVAVPRLVNGLRDC
ncbi:hypothetical protein Bbelb_438100 [Branchiostoma belcheri]|nr:hypothetical protein Bbelb_438100 [Branchiostoma belcheri]